MQECKDSDRMRMDGLGWSYTALIAYSFLFADTCDFTPEVEPDV